MRHKLQSVLVVMLVLGMATLAQAQTKGFASHIYAAIWLIWLSGATMLPWLSYTLFGLMGLATAGFSLTWACAKEVNPPLLSGMSPSVANMW